MTTRSQNDQCLDGKVRSHGSFSCITVGLNSSQHLIRPDEEGDDDEEKKEHINSLDTGHQVTN